MCWIFRVIVNSNKRNGLHKMTPRFHIGRGSNVVKVSENILVERMVGALKHACDLKQKRSHNVNYVVKSARK